MTFKLVFDPAMFASDRRKEITERAAVMEILHPEVELVFTDMRPKVKFTDDTLNQLLFEAHHALIKPGKALPHTSKSARRTNAPLYANLFASMVPIAREHGYALAVHGSVQRDLDLIAVPWVEDPKPAAELVAAITKAFYFDHVDGPEQKLHGRLAWTLAFPGTCFVDLSVLPAKAPEPVWPPAF